MLRKHSCLELMCCLKFWCWININESFWCFSFSMFKKSEIFHNWMVEMDSQSISYWMNKSLKIAHMRHVWKKNCSNYFEIIIRKLKCDFDEKITWLCVLFVKLVVKSAHTTEINLKKNSNVNAEKEIYPLVNEPKNKLFKINENSNERTIEKKWPTKIKGQKNFFKKSRVACLIFIGIDIAEYNHIYRLTWHKFTVHRSLNYTQFYSM